MDYDRNDALLHWIFRQTQGDAWFRPNEETVSSGVALRVSESGSVPEYRVFPYETPSLLPFLSAITPLAPLVAVKTRSAAVHAALAEVSSLPSSSSLPASSPQVPVPPSPRLPPSQTPSGTGSPTPSSSAPPPSNPNVGLPTSLYVDSETRIQIVDTMLHLPTADLNQNAAFIRDERVLVVWAESIDRIVPLCNDIEERLIKLLWRSRPNPSSSLKSSTTAGYGYGYGSSANGAGASGSTPGSVSGHGDTNGGTPSSHEGLFVNSGGLAQKGSQILRARGAFGELGRDPLEAVASPPSSDASLSEKGPKHRQTKTVKRTWYGGKRVVDVLPPGAAPPAYGTEDEKTAADVESGEWLEDVDTAPHKRPVKLLAPIYNGVAAGLALVFVGNGVRTLLMEWRLDANAIRFALLACVPLLYCVSLFFALQIVQNVGMAIGPIAHFHSNSKYYSALKPRANKVVDERLPHVTIQMPVYKESLEQVLAPSIRSLKKAMQTYARQGGTSNIFINDDGLRLLPPADRDARLAFYANHNIGWVARPRHDAAPGGFKRAGRFKKASNMNYGLALSLKMEKHLDALIMSADESHRTSQSLSNAHSGEAGTQYGIQYQNRDGDESVIWGAGGRGHMPGTPRSSAFIGAQGTATPTGNNPTGLAHWGDADLEERALSMAIEEAWEEDTSERKVRPWAANGRGCRVGEIVLIVDSDTVVPEDCLRDAAREMAEDPRVAIIQHESDVLKVVGHYFENGIAYFTRRINRCISISCANGEVAPFMGHNAFLRWRAIQDAAFVDPADGQVKIWSESNVSEDFDMALRLMLRGYLIRWATYSEGGFKEGVSLSADDELNRWQKYAYGCNELLFNPIIEWWRKGPISRQIHRFLWSGAPLHYKISMLSYMFSYYGIAGSITIGLINYVLLGFQFEVDGYFMHAFEIWLATTVVFWGSGTIGYTLLEYRLGRRSLLGGLWENLMWIPFFFFFFGGLAIPLTQAILAHLFSYNMQWAATKKEVERSNFFKEIPKIAKRFWFPLLLSFSIIAGIIVLSTRLVPFEWRVTGEGWAVILPLALTCGCHILYPIVLNPWLMVFSY